MFRKRTIPTMMKNSIKLYLIYTWAILEEPKRYLKL